MNLDIAGREAGSFEYRLRINAYSIFDLRVADERNSPCCRLTGQRNQNDTKNR